MTRSTTAFTGILLAFFFFTTGLQAQEFENLSFPDGQTIEEFSFLKDKLGSKKVFNTYGTYGTNQINILKKDGAIKLRCSPPAPFREFTIVFNYFDEGYQVTSVHMKNSIEIEAWLRLACHTIRNI